MTQMYKHICKQCGDEYLAALREEHQGLCDECRHKTLDIDSNIIYIKRVDNNITHKGDKEY